MSPEQVRGAMNQTDARTDIFSLGVVLYRLLTGRLPFEGRDPTELRRAILVAEPRPLRSLNAAVPGKLERICLKALAKEPGRRYSAAKEFAADLQSIADAHKHRWFRRALAAIAALIIILVGVWYLWHDHGQQAPAQRPPSAEEMVAGLRKWAKSHPPQPVEPDRTGEKVLAEAMSRIREITSPQIGKAAATPSEDTARPDSENVRKSTNPPTLSKPGNERGRPMAFPTFNTTLDLTGKTLTESDYEAIGRYLLLRRLILANTATTDAHLSHLGHVPGLEYLDLSGTQVTDAGLKAIANLPMLSHLVLARTGITDVGLKEISPLRLRTLQLGGTKITDAGLASLCDRYGVGGYLRELDIRNMAISDAALTHLKRLTRLESLRVDGTRITERGMGELRAAIPGCKIIQ